MKEHPGHHRHDAERLLASLPPVQPVPCAVLVIMSGLPGTGKSYLSRQLTERFPILHVESDALRSVLFPKPTFSPAENARLFPALHRLIDGLLGRKFPVLLDATNLVEAHRKPLYRIAERQGARLAIVRTEAPEPVVRERLAHRKGSGRDAEDRSDADWSVYLKMRQDARPISRKHYAVDTSGDITPVVRRLVQMLRRWTRGPSRSQGAGGEQVRLGMARESLL